jgi:hypothetical protein
LAALLLLADLLLLTDLLLLVQLLLLAELLLLAALMLLSELLLFLSHLFTPIKVSVILFIQVVSACCTINKGIILFFSQSNTLTLLTKYPFRPK